MSDPLLGSDEDLPGMLYRKDVYDFIDPHIHYTAKTFRNKVVFITGGSRGIGAETALQYARAGASLALASRDKDALEAVKANILGKVENARILVLPVDITDTQEVAKAIGATIAEFDRLDILIANAGKAGEWTKPLLDKSPDEWWSVIEVNLRGAFNSIYIPHLRKTKGYAIVVSSKAAQIRVPYGSDYCVSKHALGRLVEQIYLEYPDIKTLALHPGSIPTEMGLGTKRPGARLTDSLELPAATMLYLTAGKADWLAGKYVSANWDLKEVEEKWKPRIIEKGGLISKLFIPVLEADAATDNL